MADMTRIKGRIAETIYPNGTGAITAESHQALLLEMVDDINSKKADQSELETLTDDQAEIKSQLTELSAEVEEINEKIGNLPQGASMIPITYAELVELRDNGNLVAGSFYRITDYITTTAQENTQSAVHPFDIIVLALSENTLAEEAYAIQSARDTDGYFANSNLAAWKLWYSLDNDTERFAWADEVNGKGVIYRMIDEWNNDLPYDFKNIMFVRYELEAPEEYIAEGNDSLWMQQLCNNVRAVFDEGVRSFVWAGIADEDKYWEDDMSQILSHTTGENFAFFTFNTDEDTDASLSGGIHDNKMQLSQTLPNNVFFGNDCNSNSFGNSCNYNSFGNYCYSNSFGNSCNYNSFGNDCNYNSFGNDCYSNSFGNSYNYNSFGNYCNSNSFGNDCYSNSFGNHCYSNSFGNDCYSNSFGNDCYYNSFGNHCYYNSFGNSSQSNELKAYYRYITFGEGVQFVTLQNETEGDYENQVQNYRVANGTHGEDGNPLVVDVTRDMGCETFIGMDSNDELKVFCLADLLNL